MPIPLALALLPAATKLISGGISAIKGAKQKRDAKNMIAGNHRPDMPIPDAILKNQKIAENLANQGMPSEQYAKTVKNIERSGIGALRSATDRRGGLMSVGRIQQTQNDAYSDLGVADANARRENQGVLMNQNDKLGRYQQNAWDWNKKQRYLETADSARALMGAGLRNSQGGLDRMLSGVVDGVSAGVSNGGFGSLFGAKKISGFDREVSKMDENLNQYKLGKKMSSFMSSREKIDPSSIPRYKE